MAKKITKDQIISDSLKELEEDIVSFVRECMKKKHPHSFLIAVLHKIQDKYGYLPKEKLQAVAQLMRIPTAKVSGVASFYNFFHLKPKGRIVIGICMGTACFVKGADQVGKKFKEILNIDYNETTQDGKFTLMETRCLGTCAMGPVVKIQDDVYSKVTPDRVHGILEKYTKE